MFGTMITDIRRMTDVNKGEIVLKSPKSVNGVVDLIEKSGGTVAPILEVTYPDKTKGKITNDMLTERMEMGFSGDNIQEMNEVIEQGKKIKSLNFVSKNNEKIYEENKSKIIPFIRK